MAQAQIGEWEKPLAKELLKAQRNGRERLKFLIGGVLILAAVAYLVLSGTIAGIQDFVMVEKLINDPAYVGKTVRLSGAVIGETIMYDSKNLVIEFTISNIPDKFDNLAVALQNAVDNPNAARVKVRVENEVKPDLLQHAAQAILTGKLGEDGVFHATELLLKCPTRFEEAHPGLSLIHSEA